MVTKAIIVKTPSINNNIYTIRIPIFESANSVNNSNNSFITYDATLCSSPGISFGLKVGDCVFISFEDNKYSKPVIIGKLFIDSDYNSPSIYAPQVLDVQNRANLPSNTKIGNYQMDEVLKRISELEYFKNMDMSNINTQPNTPPSDNNVGEILYSGSGLTIQNGVPVTFEEINFNKISKFSLMFMRCYFADGQWGGSSFGVWFNPQVFVINPNDTFSAPMVLVGDDWSYIRSYGMKFRYAGGNWYASIAAGDGTISQFNIVEMVGVVNAI